MKSLNKDPLRFSRQIRNMIKQNIYKCKYIHIQKSQTSGNSEKFRKLASMVPSSPPAGYRRSRDFKLTIKINFWVPKTVPKTGPKKGRPPHEADGALQFVGGRDARR